MIHWCLSAVDVCVLPNDHPARMHFVVRVVLRNVQEQLFAVTHGSRYLGKDGTWDYESLPSNRTDDWLADHRFPYDQAKKLAMQVAPLVTVNGKTAKDVR